MQILQLAEQAGGNCSAGPAPWEEYCKLHFGPGSTSQHEKLGNVICRARDSTAALKKDIQGGSVRKEDIHKNLSAR